MEAIIESVDEFYSENLSYEVRQFETVWDKFSAHNSPGGRSR